MKNRYKVFQSFSIIPFIIAFLLLSSCANLKVIEESAPQKPSWIYGI